MGDVGELTVPFIFAEFNSWIRSLMLLGLICSKAEFGSSSTGKIISEFLELKGEGDLLLLLALPTLQVDSSKRENKRGRERDEQL